jgi:hypothetical protein
MERNIEESFEVKEDMEELICRFRMKKKESTGNRIGNQ